MKNVDLLTKDYLASRLITQGKIVDGYSKLYYKANEDLINPCLDVDFNGKKVLSVLSSGDQVLTSRFLDAQKVDAFDINRLTIYYFYLRLWTIKYRHELYPEIKNGHINNGLIRFLLKHVEPQNDNEEKAFIFFQKHINANSDLINLFFTISAQPEGNTLYTKADELEDCLNPDLDFYHIDLFNKINVNNTYDIILMSNILDWAKGDVSKIQMAHDNLQKLLSKDGIILCNTIFRTYNDMANEQEIFSEGFTTDYNITKQNYTYTRK